MKNLISVILTLALMFSLSATAEAKSVSTPEELFDALADESVDSIEIVADMTITDSYVMQTKDVTILSDVTFMPAPDDGFFVKSWEIPEGVKLTVNGNITTVHTFVNGFVIAQFYINGGTLDIESGSTSDDCNICFNAGELVAPADGFGPDVAVERYLYEDVTEQNICEALAVENLSSVTVQAECTVEGNLIIPEGKQLVVSTMLTVADGAAITGETLADPGCGFVIIGSGCVNDVTVPDDMESCTVIMEEDGSYTITECEID